MPNWRSASSEYEVPYGCRPLESGELIQAGDVFYSNHDGALTVAKHDRIGDTWCANIGIVQYYRQSVTPRGNKFVSLEL